MVWIRDSVSVLPGSSVEEINDPGLSSEVGYVSGLIYQTGTKTLGEGLWK